MDNQSGSMQQTALFALKNERIVNPKVFHTKNLCELFPNFNFDSDRQAFSGCKMLFQNAEADFIIIIIIIGYSISCSGCYDCCHFFC